MGQSFTLSPGHLVTPSSHHSEAASTKNRLPSTTRSVKMHVPPPTLLPLPDAGLFDGGDRWAALLVEALIEPDVGDDGHIPHQTDVRAGHRCRPRALGR